MEIKSSVPFLLMIPTLNPRQSLGTGFIPFSFNKFFNSSFSVNVKVNSSS